MTAQWQGATIVGMARSKIRTRGPFLIGAGVLLMVATMALATIGMGPRFSLVTGAESVTISGATLKGGEIRFFSYRDDVGKEIRFILGRDESGHVRGAFDACQRCAQYGKGYTSSHGYMVCRYCGNRYKIDAVPSGTSCAPIRLKVRASGDTITVDTSELKQQRNLF